MTLALSDQDHHSDLMPKTARPILNFDQRFWPSTRFVLSSLATDFAPSLCSNNRNFSAAFCLCFLIHSRLASHPEQSMKSPTSLMAHSTDLEVPTLDLAEIYR